MVSHARPDVAVPVAVAARPRRSRSPLTFARRRPGLALGGLLSALLVALAVLAPWVAPYNPDTNFPASSLLPPSDRFVLGTDNLGRDLLSRVVFGGRASLSVAALTTLLGLTAGTMLGLIAGYAAGLVDDVIMRAMDVLFAFPPLLLALGVISALGPDLRNLVLAVAIVNTPRFARLARALVLTLRQREFVEAARVIGASGPRIVTRHLLPQMSGPLLVQAFTTLSFSFIIEASLSFLGLGVQPPTPSWGSMLSQGRQYMESAPWVVLSPSLMLIAVLVAFNFAGDGIQDWLDPRRTRG